MKRPVGYLSLLVALASAGGAWALRRLPALPVADTTASIVSQVLLVASVIAGGYGLYLLVSRYVVEHTVSKRRGHDALNLLRFVFVAVTIIGVLAVLTGQWVGLLFSLGVVGFAVTFALQQPLFSLIGWFYIMVKRPYQVGDRIAIEESKGDVVKVDFFVTTLWEINGDLVTSNQPSGRIITLPNSVVLSSHVKNYTREEFPFVWNELSIQVAYETDMAFAQETMVDVADDLIGKEMADRIQTYRERLAETPVELEVRDGPTVNVIQKESWVELRLRYLVHPRRGQRVRNELYTRILERFNADPDRVRFPVSRNR